MSLTVRLLLTVAAATLVVSACSDNDTDTATDDQPSTTANETDDQTSTSGTTPSETSTTTETTETTSTSDASDPDTTTSQDEATCSASGVERPGPQPDLPDAVAQRREAILTAALACDIDGLAALTGPSFTASFGGGDPAMIWTDGEEVFDNEPMRALVEILRLPSTSTDSEEGVFYGWPPAFAYENWEAVPEADREALRVLYDDDDFEGFAQFGGYIGYRASIAEDGTWTVFVAGD